MKLSLPVNDHGKVVAYSVESGKPLSLHPIDAREHLRLGTVRLEPEAAKEQSAPAEVAPSGHLEGMTVKELEAHVATLGLELDLSRFRLKEEKVEAVRNAMAEMRKAETEDA